MSPLLKMPRAQATKPARAQPACGRSPEANDQPKQRMARLIQHATSGKRITLFPMDCEDMGIPEAV